MVSKTTKLEAIRQRKERRRGGERNGRRQGGQRAPCVPRVRRGVVDREVGNRGAADQGAQEVWKGQREPRGQEKGDEGGQKDGPVLVQVSIKGQSRNPAPGLRLRLLVGIVARHERMGAQSPAQVKSQVTRVPPNFPRILLKSASRPLPPPCGAPPGRPR